MAIKTNQLLGLIIFSTLLRLLLVPAYYSTDFDVHRNWLRITYNQPLDMWYRDDKSIWTLDYPPLFAYFEYLLTIPARWLCPKILSDEALECHTRDCVFYQRGTVMLSEMFYLFALVYALKKGTKEKNNFSRLAVLFLQFGLMLLDDIHFQYNSFLQGLLILSVQMILDEKYLMGAFLFSTLLNFKHIYLYAAPIYFIYLLGAYVKTDLGRLIKVAGVTLLLFAVAFLPLILAGGFEQVGYVMARLFPFERGLVHAYWAPNFWALYYFADRVIAALGFKQRNLTQATAGYSSTLKVLPNVSAGATIIIILLVSLPLYMTVFIKGYYQGTPSRPNNRKTRLLFIKGVIISGMIFFFFGYHVHQKAIIVYICLGQLYFGDKFWPWALVSGVNLLPLIITKAEKFLKIVMLVLYLSIWGGRHKETLTAKIAILGAIVIVGFHQMIHPFLGKKYEFLPLLMNSVWAASFNLFGMGVLIRDFAEPSYKEIPQSDEDEQEATTAASGS